MHKAKNKNKRKKRTGGHVSFDFGCYMTELIRLGLLLGRSHYRNAQSRIDESKPIPRGEGSTRWFAG